MTRTWPAGRFEGWTFRAEASTIQALATMIQNAWWQRLSLLRDQQMQWWFGAIISRIGGLQHFQWGMVYDCFSHIIRCAMLNSLKVATCFPCSPWALARVFHWARSGGEPENGNAPTESQISATWGFFWWDMMRYDAFLKWGYLQIIHL